MKVLHLTLKKKWFDMVDSGEKREEYRDLKEFWNKRFNYGNLSEATNPMYFLPKKFDYIHFANGYNRPRTSNIKWEGIRIGIGNPEWGASGKEQFIIKLGEILK